MKVEAHVKVDLKPLDRFALDIRKGLTMGSGRILKALKQWAERYRSFAQERFHKYSKGGGDWPDLAPSTKRRRRGSRRGHEGARVFAILRDTNTLFAALDPVFVGEPGALEEKISYGIRVGYGGPMRHPKGKATIFDIARFHQEGSGTVPQREIIVDPNQSTIKAMAEDMLRAVEELRKDSERG